MMEIVVGVAAGVSAVANVAGFYVGLSLVRRVRFLEGLVVGLCKAHQLPIPEGLKL